MTDKEQNTKKLKIFWTVLRIIIGIGLIIFLLQRFELNKVLQNISAMDIKYLLYTLILYAIFIIISVWRWQVLLNHKKMAIPFGRTAIIYLISLFFNNFLPTTVGGDVMRVVYSMREKKSEAVATVLADRILGFVGLFIFALAAVLYLLIFQNRKEFLSLMLVGLAGLILVTYILFSEKVYAIFAPIIEKIKVFRAGERLSNLHRTMTDFGGAWGVILLCIVQSIIIQTLVAFAPFLVLRSMHNFEVSVLPFFIYVPIINIISTIPVSLNGLGVRENFYVLLFARAGLNGETSLTMSLVSFFLVFIYSLIGGIFFIFFKNVVKKPHSPA